MIYEYWISPFDQIQICNISPDTLKSNRPGGPKGYKWNCLQYDGEWLTGRSAGGCGQGRDKQKFWTNVILNVFEENQNEFQRLRRIKLKFIK